MYLSNPADGSGCVDIIDLRFVDFTLLRSVEGVLQNCFTGMFLFVSPSFNGGFENVSTVKTCLCRAQVDPHVFLHITSKV